MPTNDDYYKNIYRIRAEIQTLDDTHWNKETWTDEEVAEYDAKRIALTNDLEAAFNA